jgi:membrane protease subunit (stomatin/prohibitin family)
MMMCEEISETVQRGQRGAIEQSREIVDPLAEERRKMEFWDAVLAAEDLQKKIAMLEEEYARIKDDPSDEAHLKRVTESLKAYRYSADPAAMAAAMTAQMEQKMQTLTEEAKAGATAAAASGTKVCPACNAEVTGKFCEYCGTKME